MRNLRSNSEHLEYFVPSVPLYVREQKYRVFTMKIDMGRFGLDRGAATLL
jgi:hypothetical protein